MSFFCNLDESVPNPWTHDRNAETRQRGAGHCCRRVHSDWWPALGQSRAGCECVARVIQALRTSTTRHSGVRGWGGGASDLVSRNSMLSGLMGMREDEQLLPLAKLFYGNPSTYLQEDEVGDVHHIHQGQGEQGDALMPMLFCLGLHGALRANRGAIVAWREVVHILGRIVCGVPTRQSWGHARCCRARILETRQNQRSPRED